MIQETHGTGQQQGSGTEDARERVRQGAEQGKNRVEETLSDVAEVTRSAADDLEQRGDAQLADLARQAATQFSSFADRLQSRNADELISDARQLAHSNPALFIGGSVGIGFALSRLFRSVGETQTEGHTETEGQGSTPGESSVAHSAGTRPDVTPHSGVAGR